MGGGLRQRVLASFLYQGEADGDGVGFVIVLCGQPTPGERSARADAADQGRRAFKLAQGALQGLFLQLAVILGQDHLNDLCSTALAQGNQLAVGQGFIGHHRDRHTGFCRAVGGHAGHDRAISLWQLFQGRLRSRAVPEPKAAACDQGEQHYKGQYIPPGASNHQRFTNPVKPPAIRAAVSASATSGSSPAGTAM